MKKYAIVTVRAGSTRLPEKCFLELGGMSVLEFVVARCHSFSYEPVVSTTINDDKIKKLCERLNVKCYQGSVTDKLVRWLETCNKFGIQKFVTVDCDDPFFDKELTDKVYNSINVCVIAPDMRAYLGSHGYGMTASTLERVCYEKSSSNTEMIEKYIDESLINRVDARPDDIESSIRLTLDYNEDYLLIKEIYKRLGKHFNRKMIIDEFLSDENLSKMNIFRNVEWKKRQSE